MHHRVDFFPINYTQEAIFKSILTLSEGMAASDLCRKCHHRRSVHTTILGSDNTECNWPHCTCGRFEEYI